MNLVLLLEPKSALVCGGCSPGSYSRWHGKFVPLKTCRECEGYFSWDSKFS